MTVMLYSTGCPMCKVLESKLNSKKIEFDKIEDLQIMQSKGFKSAPQLEIDNAVYDFNKARKLIDKFTNAVSFEEFVKSQVTE